MWKWLTRVIVSLLCRYRLSIHQELTASLSRFYLRIRHGIQYIDLHTFLSLFWLLKKMWLSWPTYRYTMWSVTQKIHIQPRFHGHVRVLGKRFLIFDILIYLEVLPNFCESYLILNCSHCSPCIEIYVLVAK